MTHQSDKTDWEIILSLDERLTTLLSNRVAILKDQVAILEDQVAILKDRVAILEDENHDLWQAINGVSHSILWELSLTNNTDTTAIYYTQLPSRLFIDEFDVHHSTISPVLFDIIALTIDIVRGEKRHKSLQGACSGPGLLFIPSTRSSPSISIISSIIATDFLSSPLSLDPQSSKWHARRFWTSGTRYLRHRIQLESFSRAIPSYFMFFPFDLYLINCRMKFTERTAENLQLLQIQNIDENRQFWGLAPPPPPKKKKKVRNVGKTTTLVPLKVFGITILYLYKTSSLVA